MKQYCRYCANCTYGDGAYCDVKKKVMRDSTIRSINKCKYFEFNEIDVLDFDKTYNDVLEGCTALLKEIKKEH